jgi:hypothetical protein
VKQAADGGEVKGMSLNGYGTEHEVRQGDQAGFSAHRTEPVNLPQLQQTVVKLLMDGQAQLPRPG